MFSDARLDVERADLGQRGVYYRVRAGYFADRTNAARFCDRIRQMGQDCIVAAR
ncbi:MAG: SPOR domain-containing protein [Hyphomonadaceae bacterium]|nr:SPOR domain-containing protein [Hyphomonadaceae bacterium]